jgi:hypothetical protein
MRPPKSIVFNGCGTATQVLLEPFTSHASFRDQWPDASLVDYGRWMPHHVEAGLVPPDHLGLPKAKTTADALVAKGWPADRVHPVENDIRARPRVAYLGSSVTVAAADSHQVKDFTVRTAQQVGSLAMAIGLGALEATVECFLPGSEAAGYCCLHGTDSTWTQRRPCMPDPKVSTTELAWRIAPDVVRQAGHLAATVLSMILAGEPARAHGARLRAGAVDWFDYSQDLHCPGPHDPPWSHDDSLSISARPEEIHIDDLLARVGRLSRYADRPLAWGSSWSCHVCRRQVAPRLHTVHPAPICTACSHALQAGFAQVSGLTSAELRELAGGPAPTLAELGLRDERILRTISADGTVRWVTLEVDE